jgi:hypothetical protein
MIGNRTCAFALSMALVILCSTPSAIAAQFDGNWSMVAVTTNRWQVATGEWCRLAPDDIVAALKPPGPKRAMQAEVRLSSAFTRKLSTLRRYGFCCLLGSVSFPSLAMFAAPKMLEAALLVQS